MNPDFDAADVDLDVLVDLEGSIVVLGPPEAWNGGVRPEIERVLIDNDPWAPQE